MDALMLIILMIIIVICLIVGIYTSLYNKIQDYLIRINEVEMILDNNLRQKYDSINKCVSIIKANEDISNNLDKNTFDDIIRLRTKKISNFDLDRKLIDANNTLSGLKEKFVELKENEEIISLTKKIDDLDEVIAIDRDYYNKNISEYNKLIVMFPTNIVAKICKYEEKLFFDRKDMSDDDVNDFKF